MKEATSVVPAEDDPEFKDIPVCKVCGEPTHAVIRLPAGLGKDGITKTLVSIECACKRKEREEYEKQLKWEKEQGRIKQLKDLSLMDERLKNVTPAMFITNNHNIHIYSLMLKYINRFETIEKEGQGLLLYGDVGVGKTYMAAVIANELMNRFVPVVMTSFIRLIDEAMKFDNNDTVSMLKYARLLIIDDLGAERGTDFALEKVYDIIDQRYRSKKPVILTTNLDLKEMMDAVDIRYRRIYDRIFEMCYPVHMEGGSWRKANAYEKFDKMKKMLEE